MIEAWSDRAKETYCSPQHQSSAGGGGQGSRRRLLPAARPERPGPSARDRHGPGRLRKVESIAAGFQWGLRFLTLMMLTLGLAVAPLLWHGAKALRALPGAGYS